MHAVPALRRDAKGVVQLALTGSRCHAVNNAAEWETMADEMAARW